jgi:DNA-binding CsgD family transcriptional regulator
MQGLAQALNAAWDLSRPPAAQPPQAVDSLLRVIAEAWTSVERKEDKMIELIDNRARFWAIVATIVGIAWFIAIEAVENPQASTWELFLEVLDMLPVVLTSVGVGLLFHVTQRQHEEHRQVLRDLEIARIQGQRWRSESRTLLDGLGQAIDTQFSRWNLTDAEREVALLLLKGLSSKEIAAVRGERTVPEQARAIYSKAGLTGRAALSAFFLEDMLAPIAVPE